MRYEFEKEMINFRDIKKCPTCLFAFIFETQHPCHELYFNLIELISRLETSKKTVSLNLHDLLSSSFLSEKSVSLFQMNGNKIGESKGDEDDDDFIIVNKVNNIKVNGTIDCVISLKESKEIQSTTANNNDKSDKIKDDKSTTNNNDDKISNNNNDNDGKRKDDKISNSNNDTDDRNCKDETQINDSSDENFRLENLKSAVYPGSLWPENAFKSRDEFLSTIYRDTAFPSVGNEITFKTGNSFLSKFMWKRPTTQFSYMRLCEYGIEPLLDWITLDDFIDVITLIFLECDVIVEGTEVESIVRIVSSFSHLIFPFAWMFPILTIVPDTFVDILGSPVPFIAGVFKSEKSVRKFFELEDSENILLIDLDERNIKWPTQKRPKISCHKMYYDELKKFCTTTKKVQTKIMEKSKSNVLIIPNETKIKNKSNFLLTLHKSNQVFMNKFKNLNKKVFYFDPEKIEDVVDTIFRLNQDVFTSKIYSSIVTSIQNSENICKAVGSMMVDEIYLSQFEDKKNDLPFVLEFMKTQMFVSLREQSCRQKTDEEAEIIEK